MFSISNCPYVLRDSKTNVLWRKHGRWSKKWQQWVTKQHSQGTRQAVNTAATLYPPPVPHEWKHQEEQRPSFHSRICTLCSPNLHLTLLCKPYPGFLGDSKMLTIASLLAWLRGCVCVCEGEATEGGKADICSILVGSRFRPSEWLQSFFTDIFLSSAMIECRTCGANKS